MLAGLITRGDLLRALSKQTDLTLKLIEVGTQSVVTVHPDELLSEALALLIRNDIGRLPVVSQKTPGKVIGYLGRSAIINAQALRLDEETRRESIWAKQASTAP